jgi:hypothetical protein
MFGPELGARYWTNKRADVATVIDRIADYSASALPC